MAKLGINTGTVPDDGTGDTLLAGAIKINTNFSEIYSYFGDGTNLTSIGGTWTTTTVGIHTLKNVGIGTTNPTSALTVSGNGRFTGVVTATTFIGNLTGTASNATYAAAAGIATYATSAGVATYSSSSGIATYATSAGVATYATSAGISTISQGLTGTPNITVGIITATNVVIGGATTELIVDGDARVTGILTVGSSSITLNGSTNTINVGSGVTIDGSAGTISATSFVGDGSGLIGVVGSGSGIVVLDDGSTVGTAGTIDFGANLSVSAISAGVVTVTATGGGGSSQWVTTAAGIHTLSNVGIGTTNPTHTLTVKGNTSLETLNVSGVVTATSFVGSNTLKSRTVVSGTTTSIVNNGIGNTNITGFKSYSLMKVGLSTAAWIRLYTDSTSRTNDASRSQGIDPAPGSGVIAEVITTGISTTQIISPFVIGGNLDNPADTTIYAAITNLSGTTQAITANLTILQLEA